MTRHEEIEAIELTPEELDDAIYEGKVKKYFREKHAPYWEEKEKEKPKKSRPNVVISDGK
jgi:hypothetical protein